MASKSFWVESGKSVMPYLDSGSITPGPGFFPHNQIDIQLLDGGGAVAWNNSLTSFGGTLPGTWNNQPAWAIGYFTNSGPAAQFTFKAQKVDGGGNGNGTFRVEVSDPTCTVDEGDLLGDREDLGEAGHPVNTATGNFFHTQVDSDAPAGVFGLGLTRTYNSADNLDIPVPTIGSSAGRYGLFGPQWTSSFDVSVRSLDSTTNPFGQQTGVELRFADGRRVTIPRTGSTWTVPPELFATFDWVAVDSQFRLTYSNGAEWRFNSSGRLASMSDGRNQRVQACPATGVISSVRSNVSNCSATPAWQITLIDSSSPADGLIDQVTYPDGASVEYTYATVASKVRLKTVTTRHKPGLFPPEVPGLWTFSHNASGSISEVKRIVTGAGDSDPHPDVIEVANHYDGNGRVDYQTLESGDHVTFAYQGITGTFPDQRRNTTVVYCTSWNTGTGACNAGPVGQPNETFLFSHDPKGRIREITDSTASGGKTSKMQWTREQLTQYDDRRNARRTGAYDPTTGRINQIGLPDPVTTATTSATVSATYCGTGGTADDARVKTTTNAAGEVTTYHYGVPDTDPQCEASSAGGSLFPTKVVDNNAKATHLTYVAGNAGLVDKATDADGIETRFAWDAAKRLLLSTTVGAVGGPTTYYGYDGWGKRKVVRTATGEETWTGYNGAGKVAVTVGPLAGPARPSCTPATGCTFPADTSGLVGPVTINQYFADTGLRTRYEVLTNGPPQQTVATNYDVRYKNGAADCSGAAPGCQREETEKAQAFSSTDTRQLTTVRRYDGRGRLLTQKEGIGAEVATTTYVYGVMGRLDVVTGPTGVETKYFYDDAGNVTKAAVGAGAASSHASFTDYDLRGRVVRQSGPDGDVDDTGTSTKSCTAFEYDQADRVTKKVQGVFDTTAGSTTCIGTARTKKLTTWFHYDKVGRLDFTVVDNDGAGAAPVWNASGVLTGADVNDHVTQRTFSDAGRALNTIEPPADATTFDFVSGSGKRTTKNVYYANAEIGAGQFPGLLNTVEDPANGAAAKAKSEYDLDGRVAKQTRPGGDYTRYVHTFSADSSRLEQTFTPSPTGTGEVRSDTTYTLNGWLKTTNEPYSGSPTATVNYAYYGNGLLQVVANPLATIDNWIAYGYDSRGNRTSRGANTKNSTTDTAHTATEQWTYNLADQQLTAKDSGGTNTWTTTYYSNAEVASGQVPGLPKTIADPSGRTETRTYWNSGQAKRSVHTQSGQPTITVDAFWSGRGQRLRTTAPTTGSGQVNTDYTYDTAGRLTQLIAPQASGNKTSAWTWSLVGNQLTMKYPFVTTGTNDTAKYGHDALDRLETVKFGNGTTFSDVGTYTYNGNDQVTDEAVAGFGTRKWDYPANGSTKPNRYRQTFASQGINTDTTLTWRADGRIQREQTVSGPDRSYTYDAAGQLSCRSQAGATCPGSVATDCSGGSANLYLYRYDPRGQRLCQSAAGTVTAYTYNADNSGRLATSVTGATTTNYSYDNAGRRTGSTGGTATTNTYDARGLIKTVVTPGGTENRRYDGEGRVVYSERGSPGAEYNWDVTQPVEQVATVQAGFVQGLALQGHGRFQFALVGGSILPQTYNWHGDTIANSVATSSPADYDPYGSPLNSAGANPDPWNWYGGFTYHGELTLQDGLDLRARTYNSPTGQFMTRDPLDGVDGTTTVANPYAYGYNDPLNEFDPLGLRPGDPELPDKRVLAGTVALTATEWVAITEAVGACIASVVCVAVVVTTVVVIGGVIYFTTRDDAPTKPEVKVENPPVENPAPTTTRPPTPPITKPPEPRNSGRIQVQGADMNPEISWPWSQPKPPTAATGISQLASLRSQLTKNQLKIRTDAFVKAEDFIRRCGSTGGCGPQSQTFQNRNLPERLKTARVDIEIKAGLAFI